MFKLYLAGAENPGWRKRLAEAGVERVAVNFTHLRGRLPKTKEWSVSEHFPAGVEVALYWTPPQDEAVDLEDFAWEYVVFAQQNREALDLVLSPPVVDIDSSVPFFAEGNELTEWVAVTEESLKNNNLRLQQMALDGQRILGVGVSDPDLMRILSACISGSWVSAAKYGETQVFDGNRLRRFSAAQKTQAAQRYPQVLRDAGIDQQALTEGDKEEATKLALWSWRQLEDSIYRRTHIRLQPEVVTQTSDDGEEPIVEDESDPVAQTSRRPVVNRVTTPIPVMGLRTVTSKDDEGEIEEVKVVDLNRETLRQCDRCFLSAMCPAYEEHASCAYNIPIELKTKDQFIGLHTAMLEMQAQRVMFARMSEELAGGYPDANTSAEMERLFSMSEKFKNMVDNRDFINIQVQAKGNAGMISRIFGDKTGAAARALPVGTVDQDGIDKILGDIIEAEVVE